MVPYRPHALREHWAVRHFWEADAAAAGRPRASRAPAIPGRRIEPHWRPREGLSAACGPHAATTSSVWTLKLASLVAPKLVERATSVASRPRAIRMRPMRGLLWRASKVYQLPPR